MSSSSRRQLILYSTSACHLCERALELLDAHPALEDGTFQLKKVDIALDDQLLNQYGEHIPVLLRLPSGQATDGDTVLKSRLFWPFDEKKLSDFLASE